MARFYGEVQGRTLPVHRLGNGVSGLETIAASWQGAVRVRLSQVEGVDMASVWLVPWHGEGITMPLYEGPVSGAGLETGPVIPKALNPERLSERVNDRWDDVEIVEG